MNSNLDFWRVINIDSAFIEKQRTEKIHSCTDCHSYVKQFFQCFPWMVILKVKFCNLPSIARCRKTQFLAGMALGPLIPKQL